MAPGSGCFPPPYIPPMTTARRFDFEFGRCPSSVRIGAGLLDSLGPMVADALGRTPRAVVLIADENATAHAERAARSLREAGCEVHHARLHATEKNKGIETFARLLSQMGQARIDRSDLVVAVGGGITGDVGGFAAACYRRGVPVVQCPTTLLAMVDASVGGKTGVNLPVGGQLQKNMVGAFHQPALVVADTDSLSTLPDREFRAGLAECVKHGLIDGCAASGEGEPGTHLDWIETNLEAILARDGAVLTELIARSVAFKGAIVAADEKETAGSGGRALLNLGHTFAHAIETLGGLSPTGRPEDAPLLHGEAVSLGLVAAFATSHAVGRVDTAAVDRVRAVLSRCGLPTRVDGLPGADELLALMGADKKVTAGRLRLVLPEPGLRAVVESGVEESANAAGWDAIR